MTKVFLLHIGAPKAGTTWLYAQLARRKDYAMGFMKEYHVWDALTLPTEADFRDKTDEQIDRAKRAPWRLAGPRFARDTWQMLRRKRFYDDQERYFDYFSGLLERPGIRLTADITPSYCGLSVETLELIKQGFAKRGVTVRAGYFIREPVERSWSAVRMHRERPASDQSRDFAAGREEVQHLRERYASDRFMVRSEYGATFAALDAVFAPEDLYVQFYEELFTSETAEDIGRFLGLPDFTPNSERRVNTTRKTVALPDALVAEMIQTYRDAYLATEARFGAERTRRNWPNHALHLGLESSGGEAAR